MEKVTLGELVFAIDGVVSFNIIFYGSDVVLQWIIFSRAWVNEN